jgi:hypothetical protein
LYIPISCEITIARLALKNGAKIDHIQPNQGHKPLVTTQVYLGTGLDLKNGLGDHLAITIIELALRNIVINIKPALNFKSALPHQGTSTLPGWLTGLKGIGVSDVRKALPGPGYCTIPRLGWFGWFLFLMGSA